MAVRRRMLTTALLGAMATPLLPAAAQPQELAKPNLVLREVIGGMPRGEQQEVQVITATFAPGQATVFHTHRFPVTVYVLEGAFTLEMEGKQTATVRAGQSMVEPPGVRMTGYNRTTEPLRVVIFYVTDPGMPFLDLAHAPAAPGR